MNELSSDQWTWLGWIEESIVILDFSAGLLTESAYNFLQMLEAPRLLCNACEPALIAVFIQSLELTM